MEYKKRFLLFASIFFLTFTIHGAYLKNVPQTLTQPDGSIIHCFATGDEFHNWLHDSLGYTIIQDATTGYFVYAAESNGDLLPTAYIVGKADPFAAGLKKEANISLEKRMEKRDFILSAMPQKPSLKAGNKNHGHINNLVFFIRFSDENDFGNYSNYYNELMSMHNDSSLGNQSNSMYSYYKQVSYGKFTVTTTAYPSSTNSEIYSYQDVFPRGYYSPYNSVTNPGGYTDRQDRTAREHGLLQRTIEYFADSVPASLDLDFDNDGNIDNICFITSGNTQGWQDLLWPHRWTLYSSEVYLHGKRVYDYNLIPIRGATLGTLTHEFMHTLGAPDLYRYDYSGTPVGQWDLMASTSDNIPQGMGIYMKYKYGNWIESIEEISSPGTYTLYPANGSSSKKTGYIYSPEPDGSQFLLFEYRKTTSTIFEKPLPSSGLLIYRINTDFKGNAQYDGVNNFDEIYIFRPGGTEKQNGNLANATFARDHNRTSFGLLTNPYPFYSNGGYMSDVWITDITDLGDSIRFTVKEMIDTMSVSSNEVVLECASGSKKTFNIASNAAWFIIGEHIWLSVNTTRGKGNQTVTLASLSANPTDVDRVCTLNIYTGSLYNPVNQKVVVRHKSCKSSISEQTDISKRVTLTPNPVSDVLNVHFQQIGEFTRNDVAVYSVQGQKIPVPVTHFQEDRLQLNVGATASGLYYLKIQTSKGSVVKTFSVSR